MKPPIKPQPKRQQMSLPFDQTPVLPRRRPNEPLPSGSEWRFDLIARYDREIARVAERYGLDT